MPQISQQAVSRRRLRVAVKLLAAGAVIVCACLLALSWWRGRAPAPPDDEGRPVLRVLFIGNSLTAANDLPQLVKGMSIAAGLGPVIEVQARTVSGAHLGDHWEAAADELIAQGGRDLVVLQQGPSSRPESREQLLEVARLYGPAIRAAGAEPAFYMVWPEEAQLNSFDRVCESYRLAAQEIDGLLLPVGEAWRIAWRLDESMPLYGPDRFHPSPAGSYLAALVICSALTGQSASDLPDPEELGLETPLSPQQVQALKQAATQALERDARVSPKLGKRVP